MEEILNEYCKQSNPGLLLLSMPTGSGKKHTTSSNLSILITRNLLLKREKLFLLQISRRIYQLMI